MTTMAAAMSALTAGNTVDVAQLGLTAGPFSGQQGAPLQLGRTPAQAPGLDRRPSLG